MPRHRLVFLWAAAAYVAAVVVVRVWMGHTPLLMADVFVGLTMAVGAVAGVGALLWLPSPWRTGGRVRVGMVVTAALSLTMIALVGAAFPSSRVLIPEFNAYWADAGLIAVERALHFGRTPFDWLAPWFTARPRAALAVWAFYQWYFVPLTILVPAVVALGNPTRVRSQYLLGWVLNSLLLANITATLFASVGPAYHDPSVMPALDRMGLHGLTALQTSYLARAHTLLGITAFPSMHLAQTTHWVLVARGEWRRSVWLTVPFLLLVLLGSIVTGWHYAVDGYAGIAGALGTWWLAGRLNESRSAPGGRARKAAQGWTNGTSPSRTRSRPADCRR